MIITTSHTVEGRTISEYLGVVGAGGVIVTMGGPKQMTPGYQRAIDDVLAMLVKSAEEKGADAIISVEFSRQKTDFFAHGTAVKLA